MGQFDQTIDPDQGLSLQPAPGLDPLSPEALGVPAALLGSAVPPAAPMRPPVPMPVPPQAPAAPGNLQQILSMAMLGLAAGLGPRHGGGGVAQGLMAGQEANDQDRRLQFQQQQIQYQNQQQEALRQQVAQAAQQRAEAVQQDQRQKALQGALTTIRTEVKTIPDKATYDTRINGYANLLKASGYRIDANWLRGAIPYVAPSSKQIAQDAVTSLFKNPLLQDQLKNNPQAFNTGSIMIDLNGDGIKEKRTIQEVMDAAGMATITDDKGQPIALTPTVTGDASQMRLKAALDEFRATNRRAPDPKEMKALVDKATMTPKDPGMANLAKEMAEQRLSDARQRSADAKTKAEQSKNTIDDMAQQLLDGDLTVQMLSKRKDSYDNVLTRANELSKEQNGTPFSAVKSQLQYEAGKRFVASMNSGNMIRFKGLAGSVVNTIDEVKGLSRLMNQSGVQFLNKGEMSAYAQFNGNSEKGQLVAQYLSAVNTLKEEFAGLVNGGFAPTEPAFALANQQVNGNYGVKAMMASLNEAQRLIKYRLGGFDDLKPTMGGMDGTTDAADPATTARQKLMKR